jgi:lactoylglutathione lyase
MSEHRMQPPQPYRLLHTMIRVSDLERSVAFYCDALGMRELRREDYPTGKFTLAFLGYDDETDGTVIELTYNYGELQYTHGTGFGHLAMAVVDIAAAVARLQQLGVKILRDPGPMSHTATNGQRDVIAFVEDPDGYRIELIEQAERRERSAA